MTLTVHLANLQNVRDVLVAERRKVAASLNPKDPLLAARNIRDIQEALKAIDEAISEERTLEDG